MAAAPLNNCTAARILTKSLPLHLIRHLQILLCIITLIFFFLNIEKPWRSKDATPRSRLRFHTNLKIVVGVASVFYVLHSLAVITTRVPYVITFYFDFVSDCSYQIVAWKCLSFRIPIYISIVGFTFFHLALCIERAVATFFLETYEKHHGVFGIFAAIIMFLGAVVCNFYIFYEEDFSALKSYCMSTTTTSARKLLFVINCLTFFDVFTTIGDFILLQVNKSQSKKKTVSNYTLRKAYQLRENKISIRLIFPLSVTHSATFSLYLLLTTVQRTFFADVDSLTYASMVDSIHLIVCMNTLLTLALFYYLKKKLEAQISQSDRETRINSNHQTDVYFEQFQRQINRRTTT
uniref:Gustatory receptor n=1 Tax=Ditylenchus dipsaci TaxID=166011 RepID=A0A915ERY7_9BILA